MVIQPIALNSPPTSTGGHRGSVIGARAAVSAARDSELLGRDPQNSSEPLPLLQRSLARSLLDLTQELLSDPQRISDHGLIGPARKPVLTNNLPDRRRRNGVPVAPQPPGRLHPIHDRLLPSQFVTVEIPGR
nr:hypothetical protein [Nocardia fluminea]